MLDDVSIFLKSESMKFGHVFSGVPGTPLTR